MAHWRGNITVSILDQRMGSVDVKLIRKNRRWDLTERQMFSSACIFDLTMLVAGNVDPQNLHQTNVADFESKWESNFQNSQKQTLTNFCFQVLNVC